MLEELRIRGLGAIAEATLPLEPGFTAITGETGTGKTMLLTGLNLLLGGRGDTGAIAAGHDRIEVDGRFMVAPTAFSVDIVERAGGTVEGGELLISRTLAREGRSRAAAGGRPVPVSLLAELADTLVTVHGQADQRGLLRAAAQREALDQYGGDQLRDVLSTYQQVYEELTELDRELATVSGRAEQRAREATELRGLVAEIEAVAPRAGEDTELAAHIGRLGQLELLRTAAAGARMQLDVDDAPSALGALTAARRALDAAAGRDAALEAIATRLADASILLGDVTAELSAYLEGLDADPGTLDAMQQRLAALRTLTRKHGLDAAGLVELAERSAARLAELEGAGDRVGELAVRRVGVVDELAKAAERLSGCRRSAAERLAAAVAAELNGLAMPGADLRVECRRRADPHGLPLADGTVAFGRHGVDEVEFLLAGHRGAAHRPLHRGASGGELSRVMLALEVVLAGADHPATFVFDEVDAGVGGRAAVEIGRRLAALAEHAQVLVVTHLPQVAAFAAHHLVVSKTERGGEVVTAVTPVTGAERLSELSRMLGGLDDSELARGHAAELLALAGQAAAPDGPTAG